MIRRDNFSQEIAYVLWDEVKIQSESTALNKASAPYKHATASCDASAWPLAK